MYSAPKMPTTAVGETNSESSNITHRIVLKQFVLLANKFRFYLTYNIYKVRINVL